MGIHILLDMSDLLITVLDVCKDKEIYICSWGISDRIMTVMMLVMATTQLVMVVMMVGQMRSYDIR